MAGALVNAELHPDVLVRSDVTSECGLSLVFRFDRDLPVSAKRIQRVEYLFTSKGINTLVHPWNQIGFLDCDCVEVAVINAETE